MFKVLELGELLLGLLAVFILSFALPVLGFLMTLATLIGRDWNLHERLIPPVVFLVATPLSVILVRTVVRILELSNPFGEVRTPGSARLSFSEAIFQATRYPHLPWLLRPFLSLWWLAHFAGGVLITVAAAQRWTRAAFNPNDTLTQTVLPSVLGLAYSFAGNLYLGLALGVVMRRPLLLERLWKWRLLTDILIMLIAGFVVQMR
jgi:hypothetical protein